MPAPKPTPAGDLRPDRREPAMDWRAGLAAGEGRGRGLIGGASSEWRLSASSSAGRRVRGGMGCASAGDRAGDRGRRPLRPRPAARRGRTRRHSAQPTPPSGGGGSRGRAGSPRGAPPRRCRARAGDARGPSPTAAIPVRDQTPGAHVPTPRRPCQPCRTLSSTRLCAEKVPEVAIVEPRPLVHRMTLPVAERGQYSQAASEPPYSSNDTIVASPATRSTYSLPARWSISCTSRAIWVARPPPSHERSQSAAQRSRPLGEGVEPPQLIDAIKEPATKLGRLPCLLGEVERHGHLPQDRIVLLTDADGARLIGEGSRHLSPARSEGPLETKAALQGRLIRGPLEHRAPSILAATHRSPQRESSHPRRRLAAHTVGDRGVGKSSTTRRIAVGRRTAR